MLFCEVVFSPLFVRPLCCRSVGWLAVRSVGYAVLYGIVRARALTCVTAHRQSRGVWDRMLSWFFVWLRVVSCIIGGLVVNGVVDEC